MRQSKRYIDTYIWSLRNGKYVIQTGEPELIKLFSQWRAAKLFSTFLTSYKKGFIFTKENYSSALQAAGFENF